MRLVRPLLAAVTLMGAGQLRQLAGRRRPVTPPPGPRKSDLRLGAGRRDAAPRPAPVT